MVVDYKGCEIKIGNKKSNGFSYECSQNDKLFSAGGGFDTITATLEAAKRSIEQHQTTKLNYEVSNNGQKDKDSTNVSLF